MASDEDLVVVCSVQTPTEAELIRNALKAVGLACEIGGETQAGFAGVLQVDLLVHADDLREARKYLRQLQREKIERKKNRMAARKAKAAPSDVNEAIQEKPPRKKPPQATD